MMAVAALDDSPHRNAPCRDHQTQSFHRISALNVEIILPPTWEARVDRVAGNEQCPAPRAALPIEH